MSRFEAGGWRHEVDGVALHLDCRSVDPGVLRLLAATLRAARLTPDAVGAVEFPSETSTYASAVVVEHVPTDFGSGIKWERTCLPLDLVLAEARRGVSSEVKP